MSDDTPDFDIPSTKEHTKEAEDVEHSDSDGDFDEEAQ